METTTQKELRRLIKYGHCEDITCYGFASVNNLREKEKGLSVIMVSHGVNGMNGALLQGNETKQFYGICGRSGSLFQLV